MNPYTININERSIMYIWHNLKIPIFILILFVQFQILKAFITQK